MDIGDNTEFRNRLVALGEVFDVKLSPQRQALYWEALRDLPFEAVARGIQQALKTAKFFPKPAELRTGAVGDVEDAIEAAWMALRHAMKQAGSYSSLVTDATLGEAITAMFGSWPQACASEFTPEMWAAKRKEFGRVYRVIADRGLTGTRYLVGIAEQQNSGRADWLTYVPVHRLAGAVVQPLSLEAAQQERTQIAAAAHGFASMGELIEGTISTIGEASETA